MTEPEQHHVVIDKSMTARVNVGILVTLVVICVGAAVYLNNIEHAVAAANDTLQEVRTQLEKQNGTSQHHTELFIRHAAKIDNLDARIAALERAK